MIEGSVTKDVPASVLQKHNDVTVIIDKDAASKLSIFMVLPFQQI